MCLSSLHFCIIWIFYNSSWFSVPKWILIILLIERQRNCIFFLFDGSLKKNVYKGIRSYVNTVCLVIILQKNAQESSRISGSPFPYPRKVFFELDKFSMCWVGCRMRSTLLWKVLCKAGVLTAGPRSRGFCQSWSPVLPSTWLEDLCSLEIEGRTRGHGNVSHQSSLNTTLLAQAGTYKPILGNVLLLGSPSTCHPFHLLGSMPPSALPRISTFQLGSRSCLPTLVSGVVGLEDLFWKYSSYLVWNSSSDSLNFTPRLPSLSQWVKDIPCASCPHPCHLGPFPTWLPCQGRGLG